MALIETQNLNYSFKKGVPIIENLNLKVDKGSIYGFLGPNGAGKTTTIRLILSLLSSGKDAIKIFGKPLNGNELNVFAKTGALIETPSMYGHLSGYDNLEITRKLRGVSKERINIVLELVHLKDAANKKAKNYSLGMKQRLGLAMALLSEPELLILDEPVNGLDPNGIIETRELLKELNQNYGTTIFLSSHLLSEIEKMATHVGIIHKGKMMFQGSTEELLSLKERNAILKIETNNNEKAFNILKNNFSVQVNGNFLTIPFNQKQETADINRLLISNDIDVYRLSSEAADLENVFLEITENKVL